LVQPEHHRSDPDRRPTYLITLALAAAVVYVLNRWLILPRTGSSLFWRNYLGDMLALPVYLPLSLYLARKLDVVENGFHLKFWHILGVTVLFTLFFEGLVPLLETGSTADPWDALAYLAGGLLVLGVSRLQ
jgi:hypothetical protein